MEEPAEIAAMAQEFITSLDNLPQEVGHLVSEIQHKEEKIQDLLPRIANREAQVRDVVTKGGANLANPGAMLPENDKAKLDKLLEKIRTDFDRVEDLSRQKEALSLQLWREVHRHSSRLKSEMDKIAPHVLASFSANDSALTMPTLTGLPAALSGLKGDGDGILSEFSYNCRVHFSDLADTRALLISERKASAMLAGPAAVPARASNGTGTPKGWRGTTPTADISTGPMFGRSASPVSNSMRGRKSLRGGRGGSSALGHAARSAIPSAGADDDMDAEGELDLDLPADLEEPTYAGTGEGADKETLYCFCQRVSFGEMIGCDAEDCKLEWFHIGCVGVSKPLPNTWYCDDCKERLNIGGHKKKKK